MDPALIAFVMAVAALFVGPALLWISNGSALLQAALDGLVLALVAGLCVLHLGPHALTHGGWTALIGLVAGVGLPALLHRVKRDHWWVGSALAMLGLHAAMDGAALALVENTLTGGVGLAVIAHRLPVGLAISLAAQTPARSATILLGLAGLTAVGFAAGAVIAPALPTALLVLVEGLIVGGLLHVVLAHRITPTGPSEEASHHDHDHDHDHDHPHHYGQPQRANRQASAAGALMGVAVLAALALSARSMPALAHLESVGQTFLSLSLTSAPALLTGFLLAGLISALLDPGRAGWLSGGNAGSQAVRGVVFGLPLPVCSCGVVPMYESLVRRGVPVTAGLAFLVATPELGLDAVLLSVPLLGWPLTVIRVLAAFGVALAVALLVGRGVPSAGAPIHQHGSDTERWSVDRLRAGLRYGLVDLVDHTLPWIVVGLLLAAMAEPLMDHTQLAALPPFVQVPLAALVGVPLYVCASGATPLAAMAVHEGMSAGAALTFLLAGPATNVTTFAVLSAMHGVRLAVSFGVTLTLTAIAVGWGVDRLDLAMPEIAHAGAAHAHGSAWLGVLSALLVLALGAASLWRQGARGVVNQILNPIHTH